MLHLYVDATAVQTYGTILLVVRIVEVSAARHLHTYLKALYRWVVCRWAVGSHTNPIRNKLDKGLIEAV